MTDWREAGKKAGNWYQVAGTRHYTLNSGFAGGTCAIDVRTGGGLEYTVVPDRGMDISLASYKGTNLVYQGPNGEANPAFYDREGLNWLHSFHAGLLTGCGPRNIGPPCEDGGETLGLHGTLSNTPAEKVCDGTDMKNGEIHISGEMKSAVLFGSQLVVKRTIRSMAGENTIAVEDIVRNEGGQESPFCMLYHINFGFPLLDDCVKVEVDGASAEPYNNFSAGFMNDVQSFLPPNASNDEKNYLYRFKGTGEGKARITNPNLGMYAEISFDTAALPYLTHWKMEGIKDYVLALEPCNCPCLPRDELRREGLLPFIGSDETKTLRFSISVGEV